MASFSMLMLVLLFAGGTDTGDLLDYAPTEMYWEMRGQRVVDLDTMSAVLNDDDATNTDTLMAIRTVAEWVLIQEVNPDVQADPADKPKAIKLLTPFVGSKKPFVDRYARRSLAWLKGEDPPSDAPLPAEVYDLDLALVPADATVAGQMKVANGVGPINLIELFPDIKLDGRSMRDQMVQGIMPGLMQAVTSIGNARVDLVTIGVLVDSLSEDATMMVVVRGQYDRVGLQIAIEKELGDEAKASFYSVGETEVVAMDSHDPMAMLMPSDEVFVLLFSERRGAKLPIDDVVKKLAQADRKPKFDDVLAKQIDALDREKSDVWAAMKVVPMMLQDKDAAKFFGAFEAGRASATRNDKGELAIEWVGDGNDAAAVSQAVDYMTNMIAEGIAEMSAEKQRMPKEFAVMMDPMVDMMKSVQFKADGKTMSGGMKLDPKIGMTIPIFGMQVRQSHGAAFEAEDAVELVEEAVAE